MRDNCISINNQYDYMGGDWGILDASHVKSVIGN